MFNHIPVNAASESIFYHAGINSWQVWKKPAGANFVYALLIGGGGGGGGGAGVNGSVGTGGAGGASSTITKGLIPAFMLPDTLYVNVAKGGTGGNGGLYFPGVPPSQPAREFAGSDGTQGGHSVLSTVPDSSSALNVLLSSGNYPGNGAGGGQGGQIGALSTGGAAASIFNTTLGLFSDGFFWTYVNGKSGNNGPTTGLNNVDPSASSCSIVLPGAPGGLLSAGGAPSTGSGILSYSFIPAISGGATSSAGSNGISTLMNKRHPTFFTSGTGGGGSAGSTGGNGGKGSYGCGGGGGGSSLFGGRGGDGGDGLVIIVAW